jgi:hypothetical protein
MNKKFKAYCQVISYGINHFFYRGNRIFTARLAEGFYIPGA